MIYRFMFSAYTKNPQSTHLLPGSTHYAALAFAGEQVFLYVESQEESVDPHTIAAGELLRHPNGNAWERAYDIFHYSVPMNPQQWKRSGEKTPFFQLNRLKPEMISSYVFYHYQFQEEYPGDYDKFGSIYLLGDQLIYYLENPLERETEERKGLLDTKHSPVDVWEELMTQHFADRWRPIENLGHSEFIPFE